MSTAVFDASVAQETGVTTRKAPASQRRACAHFQLRERGTLRASVRVHIWTALANGGIPPGLMNSRGGPPRLRQQLLLPYKAGPGGAGGVAALAPPGASQLLGPATQRNSALQSRSRGVHTAGHGQVR